MESEASTLSKSKLGQAMQDAALANINEDINNIHDTLENIINEFPEKAENQLESVRESILSLEQALKVVPQAFEQNFAKKMNNLIDATNEIDLHSKKLSQTLKKDMSQSVIDQSELLAKEFNKRLGGQTLISTWTLFKFGIYCTILGGFLSAVLASWFVWVGFPKVF
ncbi:hypothetical protein [uncultured Shewanella sp.]|uniref:hypothetical protein n=1 Tax=uncultured Shewanella sp. TaxID=173975 RepID=UPI002618F140|nr:hypothetical protein [uncultured Shewanella sp.]